MTQFAPYEDEVSVLTIDELTVENRVDRVELYGRLEITRDQAGLELARQMKTLVDAIVARLESETLPARVLNKARGKLSNPFK